MAKPLKIEIDKLTGHALLGKAALEHCFREYVDKDGQVDYAICRGPARIRPLRDGSWVVEELNSWGYDGAWGRWIKVLHAKQYGKDNEAVAEAFSETLRAMGHNVTPAELCKPCAGTGKVERRKREKGRTRVYQGRCRRCLGTGWMSPSDFEAEEEFKERSTKEDVAVAVTPPTRRITQDQLSALNNVKAILASITMARRLLAEAKTPEEAARYRAYIEGRERDLEREGGERR